VIITEPNIESYMCKCGHELHDHVKFEEIKEGTELKHKCNGKTVNGEPCTCKVLERV